MTLHGLEKEQLEFIIGCVKKAGLETPERGELLDWMQLQFTQQQEGGAWKRRIRDLGHVI
jgi:hypothetical protein